MVCSEVKLAERTFFITIIESDELDSSSSLFNSYTREQFRNITSFSYRIYLPRIRNRKNHPLDDFPRPFLHFYVREFLFDFVPFYKSQVTNNQANATTLR